MPKLTTKLVLHCLDCDNDFTVTRKNSCNTKEWLFASTELEVSNVKKLVYLFKDPETWVFYPYFHCVNCDSTNFDTKTIVLLYKKMKARLQKRKDLTSFIDVTRILDAYMGRRND